MGMFSLRRKLIMGFGGLLVILLMVSGLSIGKFIWENWRSVEYGRHMLEAIGAMDDMARGLSNPPAAAGTAEGVNAQAAGAIREMDENVEAEDHNITLVTEDEIAGDITRL